jgi:uncharacterized membrane protein
MFLLAAVNGPSPKDVVIAEIGAAAAFVGFVLVFLGILITTYQSLLGGPVSKESLARFKTAGWVSVGGTILGLTSVVLSTAWLVLGAGHGFYVLTLVVFLAELASVVATAIYSTRLLLR